MWKNKSGEKIDALGVILIVIALLVAGKAGLFTNIFPASAGDSGTSGASGGTAPSNTVTVVGAPCTQGTTLTMSVLRRYTDVEQTGENVTIYQNGVLKGTVKHGSTTTVQSGPNADLLDLYPAFDRSTTFYSRHLRGKLNTCTSSATSGDPTFKAIPASEDLGDEVKLGTEISYGDFPNKLMQMDTTANTDLFSIVNDGQANANGWNVPSTSISNGANLTIGIGGSGSVTITFRPSYNKAIGPKGNVLACQYPQSVYDASAPLSVSYQGVKLDETNTKPSTQNYPLINSNNTVKAFAFPGVDGRLTPTAIISVVIRADANHDPQGANDRINCTMFDSNYYTRQRDGKVVLDIENRDNNNNLGVGGTGAVVNTNPEHSFEIGVA